MSGPFKLPSIDDVEARRRTKKGKRKVGSASEEPASTPLILSVQEENSQQKAAGQVDEDPDYNLVKVPRYKSVFSNPSVLEEFAGDLLLEEDGRRLESMGVVEMSKFAVTRSYEVLETSLHFQKTVRMLNKRNRDLDRSNAQYRSQLTKAKEEFDAEIRKLETNMEAFKLQSAAELEDERRQSAEYLERLNTVAGDAMVKMRYDLMKDFVAGNTSAWRPEDWIRDYEEEEAEMDDAPAEGGDGGEGQGVGPSE